MFEPQSQQSSHLDEDRAAPIQAITLNSNQTEMAHCHITSQEATNIVTKKVHCGENASICKPNRYLQVSTMSLFDTNNQDGKCIEIFVHQSHIPRQEKQSIATKS